MLLIGFQPSEMTKTASIKSPIPDEAVRSLSADISSQERMSLQGKQKRFNVGSCEVPFFVANFCFAVIVLVGEVGHKVTLPMWLDHSNATNCAESSPDNYFVLSFSSLVFVLIFGLGTLFIRVFSPKAIGEAERNFPHRLFFLVGFSDAVNGILVVFAANGTRTPPYLQSILGNFLIPLTVLFRWVNLTVIVWFSKLRGQRGGRARETWRKRRRESRSHPFPHLSFPCIVKFVQGYSRDARLVDFIFPERWTLPWREGCGLKSATILWLASVTQMIEIKAM